MKKKDKKNFLILLIIEIVIICYLSNIFFIGTKLSFDDQTIKINILTNKYIDLEQLQGENNVKVQKKGIASVKINGKKITKEPTDLGIIEISKDNKLKIVVNYFLFLKKTYYVNTLPSDLNYIAKGKSEYEGDYYLTTYPALKPYVFKIDEEGKTLFYKKAKNKVYDFKKSVINGEIFYSYIEKVTNEMEVHNTSYETSKLVILNKNYDIIDEVRYLNEDGTKQPLENHGALILGKGHYILVTVKEDIIEHKTYEKVTHNYIEEVKDGKILWQFKTSDYKKLYDYNTVEAALGTEGYVDYIHYNSCDIDKNDNNLLCSFRSIDGLMKINRKTGELMWILGGKGDQFGLKEHQKFAKQHSVTYLKDGTIMIFNNGNIEDKTNSNIIKIKVDEKKKKILKYEKYNLKAKSKFMGSVQALEENEDIILVCYGGTTNKELIEEINTKTNKSIFSLEIPKAEGMYRAYKIK